MNRHHSIYRYGFALIGLTSLIAGMFVAIPTQTTEAQRRGNRSLNFSRRPAPNVDVNLTASAKRLATGAQQAAVQNFKAQYGAQATIRWNDFAGSPDVMMGFHTAPSTDTPESVARNFVNSNAQLFGVTADSLIVDEQKEGLGGYMIRFKQVANGLDVSGGGIGFLMSRDKEIRMVMGSAYRDVNVASTTPALTAAAANGAVTKDLARFAGRNFLAGQRSIINTGLDAIAAEVAPVLRAPRLNIYPTADGYKLSWDVITFSRVPFGVFKSQVDASTGEILKREDQVRYQDDSLPYTADIYPSTPGIADYDTGALKLVNGEPEGLQRVQLRGYFPGMNATAVNGTLSGPHALVRNVLPGQQPFAQASAGTFHFRTENAPLEAHPNEADDRAEPAEHFDGVNMFFFINYLLEYVDDIHKRGDAVHNPIGTGDFPDNYVNSDRPLVGLVHIPNIGATADIYQPEIDKGNAVEVALGYDNAGSLPITETVDTPLGPQKVVVNPTIYGHGYFLNDPAKDGPVAYHEGMHSISTPIAGLEGTPEGSAMNEGQADLWAYAISGADSIGEHTIKGARYRQLYRDNGRDPDALSWIRSAHSSLKYSQLGTLGTPPAFEEHKDGEIYAATMFELFELMKAAEPALGFSRPAFEDGQITRKISKGQEAWERIFLGSLYLLGLTSPDTFIKARDTMIQADRILYPTDATDLDAPGQHEALIWRVFAAREIGVNAKSPQGGVVTISTGVPESVLSIPGVGAPQGVTVAPASPGSVNVSWQPVNGAFAYQVFKRKKGNANQRQYRGIPGRPYFDGDQATTGWSHVGYANGATNFEDAGVVREYFKAAGIKSTDDASGFNEMFDTEYAVRAISMTTRKTYGFSDLSGSASMGTSIQDVSSSIDTALTNVQFANGIFEFDQTLKNKGTIPAADTTAYGPVNFRVFNISNPTVTANNADNGGSGQGGSPAVFGYGQTIASGQTSSAKRLRFNDPNAQLFTFDALVTARVRGASMPANGSQAFDGTGGGEQAHVVTSQEDTYTGTIIVGSLEVRGAVSGVDYVDVPFTAKPGSFGVTGVLTTDAPADLDFELHDAAGNVLSSSGNFLDAETCSAVIEPGKQYYYRVIGYANGPTQFTIKSTQYFSDSLTSGSPSSGSQFNGGQTAGVTRVRVVRFTVNPLLRTVAARLL